MSWSVIFIGTPDKIAQALQKYSDTTAGKSKEEFDAALPSFLGLLAQNYNKEQEPTLKFSASGHGHDAYNTCLVSMEYLYGVLV